MLSRLLWSLWAIIPVLGLAFHFGPGQKAWQRDQASTLLAQAQQAEQDAEVAQHVAHEAHLRTIEQRKQALISGDHEDQKRVSTLLEEEKEAYAIASDAWKDTADRYQAVETLLGDTDEADEVRWAKGRAMVRAGLIWTGIGEFQALLDQCAVTGEMRSPLAIAAREELAAAHYYGARILRDEGKPEAMWREVSGMARQQYRYLAEQAERSDNTKMADSLQKNLERVLDLEQLDTTELFGEPLPRESPRARRPGDGPPGRRPGRGPLRDGPPGNGAGGLMEIGPGW